MKSCAYYDKICEKYRMLNNWVSTMKNLLLYFMIGFRDVSSASKNLRILHAYCRGTAANLISLPTLSSQEGAKCGISMISSFLRDEQLDERCFNLITRAERTNFQMKSLLIVRIDESGWLLVDIHLCWWFSCFFVRLEQNKNYKAQNEMQVRFSNFTI